MRTRVGVERYCNALPPERGSSAPVDVELRPDAAGQQAHELDHRFSGTVSARSSPPIGEGWRGREWQGCSDDVYADSEV